MRPIVLTLALASVALASAAILHSGKAPAATAASPASQGVRPNILLIVADDIGWSDLGAFGGEIATPNLDRLALAGVRFTGFHTAPTCSPTRSMLMSGVDNHEAGLGSMAELLTPEQRGQPGYEGYLNERVASIAELLRDGGYRTVMAGKWHLGLDEAHSPAARGFERSFALLQGLGNHFGADQGPEWARVEQATYREGLARVPFPAGAYSTDLFADKLIGYLGEKDPSGRPFFAYLAFSAPHWPLMAPEADVARYKGRYDAGPEALRAARLAREKRMGLVPADATAHAPVGVTPWSELTPAQRAVEARKMEVYAAMVDHLDRRVGTVLDALRASGQLRNTLILFMGDNGPEGNRIDAPKGITDPARLAALHVDNSLANIGRPTSYVGYGPGWAQANSAPSWLMKGYTTEGGTRVAAFASGAGVAGGRVSQAFLHVTDVAPTLLAEAGLRQPANFGGHAILPYEGRSMAPLLAGRQDAVRGEDETVAWELFYGRAIRRGRWKAVYIAPGRSPYLSIQGRGQWQLFDLATDPGETIDLGTRQPARLAELVTAWNAYARAKGVVLPSGDGGRHVGSGREAAAVKAWGTTLAFGAVATLLGAAPGADGSNHTLGRCRAVDGIAAVPAGIVPLGEDGEGAPGEQVAVPAFRIDRHEVTNVQFAAFVRATGYRTQAEREGAAPVFVMPRVPVSLDDPRGWWRMTKGADWRHPRGALTTLAGHLDEPVVQVSFEDAQAYARWAGGALPTVAQWERAARGSQPVPRDPDSWRHDSTGRATANSWQGVFPLVDTGTDGHAGLAPVGCYEANDWGLVDMVGNAWEWTLDEAGPGRRVLKGGSFLCAENYCANYRPAAWQAQDHDLGASHIGFRVVYAAESRGNPTERPSSLVRVT